MADNTASSKSFPLLAFALPLSLVLAAALIYLQTRAVTGAAPGADAAALAQHIALAARRAVAGEPEGYAALGTALERLAELGRDGALSPAAGLWNRLEADAASVLDTGDSLTRLRNASEAVAEEVPAVVGEAGELLESTGAVDLVQRFQLMGIRLAQTAESLPEVAEEDAERAAVNATQALAEMREMLAALAGEETRLDVVPVTEEAALARVESLRGVLEEVNAELQTAIASLPALAEARGAADRLAVSADALYRQVLADAGAGVTGLWWASPWLPLILVGLALALSAALLSIYARAASERRSTALQADQNERNQQAILRLLDELGSLADGDLTVEATVTEDITGAIADSINYAIEALRELVATINDTAIMVDSATKQTETTASHMNRATLKQIEEVGAVTESIATMVASIEAVSGNAERSSDVARHSVDVAHKGGEAVRRTIDGMNTIRETIQETSKRIKRLGESSQEIGNIVELINDIAEQTNILALNASIQASMAGEAGRGFAVVADEVQRLAERSTNATKQIEVLVRTIQADTNEAVVSMERSTTDVVGGALLAENAGAALDEIEQVSNQIASLVQNISGSAREQSSAASDITRRTESLKQISVQAGRATQATTASIAKLSQLASELRQSVAGFRLPDHGRSSAGIAETDVREVLKRDPDGAPEGESDGAPEAGTTGDAQSPGESRSDASLEERAAEHG